MKNDIFITGASGYIGKEFLSELVKREATRTIYCLILNSEHNDFKNVKFIKGNLLKPSSYQSYLNNCKTVFHLAGYVKHKISAREKNYKANYIGTKKILEASIDSGVSDFVYLGSAGVFHSHTSDICNETLPHTTKHSNYYCYTKYISHQLVRIFSKRGLSITTIMPVSIYSKDAPMFLELIDFLYKRKIFFKSLLDKKIFLVSRKNVTKALISFDSLGPDPDGYLLTDDSISMREIIDIISKELSIKIRVLPTPQIATSIILNLLHLYTIFTDRDLYVNKENYNFLNGNLRVNSSKVRKRLKLEEGNFRNVLKKMAANYRMKLNEK